MSVPQPPPPNPGRRATDRISPNAIQKAQAYATLVVGVGGAAAAVFLALTGRGFNGELYIASTALLGAHAAARVANGDNFRPEPAAESQP